MSDVRQEFVRKAFIKPDEVSSYIGIFKLDLYMHDCLVIFG